VASSLSLLRGGAVGFIGWLDVWANTRSKLGTVFTKIAKQKLSVFEELLAASAAFCLVEAMRRARNKLWLREKLSMRVILLLDGFDDKHRLRTTEEILLVNPLVAHLNPRVEVANLVASEIHIHIGAATRRLISGAVDAHERLALACELALDR
jgi:hypothetical protein